MQPDPRTYLWDAREAASNVAAFVAGRSWEDYEADLMLRSAVERQFVIIGEALNQLRRTDEPTADRVPDLSRIVAFRNVIVHAYAAVDDCLVWEVATERVPSLIATFQEILDGWR
ncbi:MAG: DUF86 domain-containing protein [Microthrixaceae bacterium]|nr:DUF86 domain-containing protein [Mycobacterium sp.]MCB9402975.1 DUF86 domain-containing protein [Microthrixaceae bacterium]